MKRSEAEKIKLKAEVEEGKRKRKEMLERFMNIAQEWDEPAMPPAKKVRTSPESTETIVLTSPSPLQLKLERL